MSGSSKGVVIRQVVIPNRQGLHARPIAMIAQAAAQFRSTFRIALDGREVDGRSILQLMTLAAAKGTVLTLRADGEDADGLIEAVARVIEDGFGEM